jgi:hypothetical protein
MLPLVANADTSANLITNGTFESGNATGWTQSGDGRVIGDCCGSSYDYEIGDSGGISQTFNLESETITAPMLDNGITLNSSVLVQNGEGGGVGAWCPNCGEADTFSIQLDILDENNQSLATTVTVRTNVTGINGKTFTDSVTWTGTGSRQGSIDLSGIDANAPATLGGVNFDNISVTMEYDPTVLTAMQTQELQEIEQVIAMEEIFIPIEMEETFVIEEFSPIETVEIFEEMVLIEPEEEFIEKAIIMSSPVEIIEEVAIEEETIEVAEEMISELRETPREPEEERPEEEEIVAQEETISSPEQETIELPTVSDIAVKVAEKISNVSDQLKLTQLIVAKAMQNNSKISEYNNINQDLFKQPNLTTINIDAYINKNYVDTRNIYPNQVFEDRLWTLRR